MFDLVGNVRPIICRVDDFSGRHFHMGRGARDKTCLRGYANNTCETKPAHT